MIADRGSSTLRRAPGFLAAGAIRAVGAFAPEPTEPARADAPRIGLFQDVPRSIWTVFLSAWATFFGLCWIFFAVGGESRFLVAIVLLFGAMAFGLPLVLSKQCSDPDYRCAPLIDTATGPVTVAAAGIQIALIPVAVVIGLLGFILFAK